MLITFNSAKNRFEAQFGWDEFATVKPIVKDAGFAFDGKKTWHTAGYEIDFRTKKKNPNYPKPLTEQQQIAGKLKTYCDASALAQLEGVKVVTVEEALEQKKEAIELSRATDANIEIPCNPGMAYLPFQKAGIAYAMQRVATLIADEMGLGKTIQAVGVANTDPTVKSVLVVCPATPKINWSKEWKKWDVKGLTVGIASGDDLPTTQVVIVNFDILKRHYETLSARTWDLLVVDECHKVKNPKAQRTRFLLGGKATKKKNPDTKKLEVVPATAAIPAKRRVFLTGTPICNRPLELWPLVEALDPTGLGKSFWKYAQRYCGATQGTFGWDFSGASNLDELQIKLRSVFMVRRLKSEVLKELPAKRRQVVLVEPDAKGKKLIEKEKIAYENYLAKPGDSVSIGELSRLRKEVALYKVPFVLEHCDDLLEDGGVKKLIIFAHHKEVVDKIMAHYGAAAVKIDGRTTGDRNEIVDRFQNDPTVKVFVGSILAAGVAITLTAASTVVFAELDWVPGNMTQAEDRAHRIGQLMQVLIQHIIFEGSNDDNMIGKLIEKQAVCDKALDAPVEVKAPVMPAVGYTAPDVKKPVAQPLSHKGVTVAVLTPSQIASVHEGLRRLRAMCDGAFEEDGSGFAKPDVQFGHTLAGAEKLSQKQAQYGWLMVRKYQGQLSPDLIENCGIIPKGEKHASK